MAETPPELVLRMHEELLRTRDPERVVRVDGRIVERRDLTDTAGLMGRLTGG